MARGVEPPVWRSGNAPGGDEANSRFLGALPRPGPVAVSRACAGRRARHPANRRRRCPSRVEDPPPPRGEVTYATASSPPSGRQPGRPRAWLAPGLVDLQVNGFGGHDVNGPERHRRRGDRARPRARPAGRPRVRADGHHRCRGGHRPSLRAVVEAAPAGPIGHPRAPSPSCTSRGRTCRRSTGRAGSTRSSSSARRTWPSSPAGRRPAAGLVGSVTVSPHYPETSRTRGCSPRRCDVAIGHTTPSPEQIRRPRTRARPMSHAPRQRRARRVGPAPELPVGPARPTTGSPPGSSPTVTTCPADALTAMLRAKGIDRSASWSPTPSPWPDPAGRVRDPGRRYGAPVGRRAAVRRRHARTSPGAARSLADGVASAPSGWPGRSGRRGAARHREPGPVRRRRAYCDPAHRRTWCASTGPRGTAC